MTKTQYNQLLIDVSSLPSLIKQNREIKKKLNKVNRKIKTIRKRYLYIALIFANGAHGTPLEINICKWLRDAGYKEVHNFHKEKNKLCNS